MLAQREPCVQSACGAQDAPCTQRPTRHTDPDAPATAIPTRQGLTDERPRQSGLEVPVPDLVTRCASPGLSQPRLLSQAGCGVPAQSGVPALVTTGEGAASEGVCAGCRGAVGGTGTCVWDDVRGGCLRGVSGNETALWAKAESREPRRAPQGRPAGTAGEASTWRPGPSLSPQGHGEGHACHHSNVTA